MSVADSTTIVGEVLDPFETVKKFQDPSAKSRTVWARYWGTTYGTSPFWFAYAQFLAKVDVLYEQLDHHSKDQRSRDLFLGAVDRLKSQLEVTALNNPISHMAGLDETFNIIYLSASILPNSMNDRIENATVDTIVADLSELLTELEAADMDAQLRAFLRGQFEFLKWAAANYAALGIDGLSKAYGMVTSEFMRAWGKQEEPAPTAAAWWQKARGKLELVGKGVIWSEKVASGAEKLLTHADKITDALA